MNLWVFRVATSTGRRTTIGIAIVGFIIAYCMAGFILALIILSVTMTIGVGLILFKRRKGLHSKRQERGVFIYAYSKKM